MRNPIFLVACGFKGSGKTHRTIETCYEYLEKQKRKVLVFDVNNEFSSFDFKGQKHSIKALYIRDIAKFSSQGFPEIRRIRNRTDDGKYLKPDECVAVLEIILAEFRDGLLVVEDINKYLGDRMPDSFIGALATARHLGIDTYCHFQSIGRLGNPKLLGQCNVLRLHWTSDKVERHTDKFKGEMLDILSIAQNIVLKKRQIGMNLKNNLRFAYVYVNFETNKILGDFTYEDAEEAILVYVSMYYKRVMGRYLNMRDKNTGRRVMDEASAWRAGIKDLLNEYFILDNPKEKLPSKPVL